jgi:hypothetical protein
MTLVNVALVVVVVRCNWVFAAMLLHHRHCTLAFLRGKLV